MEDRIRQIYKDPKVGEVGVNAFHDKLIVYGIDIDLDELKRILSKKDSYTINKPAKHKFIMRKVIIYNVYEQLLADLVFRDVKQGAPAKLNDNVKYLFTIIDVQSKYVWVVPLKNKTGKSIPEAFQPILEKNKAQIITS